MEHQSKTLFIWNHCIDRKYIEYLCTKHLTSAQYPNVNLITMFHNKTYEYNKIILTNQEIKYYIQKQEWNKKMSLKSTRKKENNKYELDFNISTGYPKIFEKDLVDISKDEQGYINKLAGGIWLVYKKDIICLYQVGISLEDICNYITKTYKLLEREYNVESLRSYLKRTLIYYKNHRNEYEDIIKDRIEYLNKFLDRDMTFTSFSKEDVFEWISKGEAIINYNTDEYFVENPELELEYETNYQALESLNKQMKQITDYTSKEAQCIYNDLMDLKNKVDKLKIEKQKYDEAKQKYSYLVDLKMFLPVIREYKAKHKLL